MPGVHAPAASCSPAVGGVQRRQQPRILSVVEATSAGLQRSGRRQPPAALWGRLRSDRLKEETVSFSALPERNSFHRYQNRTNAAIPCRAAAPRLHPDRRTSWLRRAEAAAADLRAPWPTGNFRKRTLRRTNFASSRFQADG